MDADRLLHYIKNPAHLYQISYTELKSLVLQYPYCQNLRYLLLKKSILENHKEKEQNLQLAATYSNDRQFLYLQIKDNESFSSEADSFVLKEDYIELKSITSQPVAKGEDVSRPKSNAEPVVIDPEDIHLIEESEVFPENNSELEEEEVIHEKQVSEDIPEIVESVPVTPANDMNSLDEEEIEDITEEFDNLFLEVPSLLEPSNAVTDSEQPAPPPSPESEVIDDAISIEELIKLDSLTPLQRMEKKNEKKKSKSDKTKTPEKDFDISNIDDLIEETKNEVQPQEEAPKKKPSKSKPKPKSNFKNVFENLPPPEFDKEGEAFVMPEPKKSKKSKKQKKTPKTKTKSIPKLNVKKEIEEKSLEKPKKIADKSLRDNEDIASETLAILLVNQGSYTKAIEMYERLSLKFPEKSSFFAEQIENLKKL
jgi:hypothetical protein